MNISLERLLEGIIATLRSDVIPNVSDAYARGQAVGVIDLLNNVGPRIEWARAPVIQAIAEKRALLRKVGELLPDVQVSATSDAEATSTAELAAERDRLDAEIGDVLGLIHALRPAGKADAQQALVLLKQHMHDELTREMKLTRKPLFAEIASGGDGKAARQAANASPHSRAGG
jgi:hypothetical protein